MRPSYNAPEAPTHLRASDLPPGLLDEVDPPTGAARGGGGSYHSVSIPTKRRPEPAPLPALPLPLAARFPIEDYSRSRSRSDFAPAPRMPTEHATPHGRPARRPESTPRHGNPLVHDARSESYHQAPRSAPEHTPPPARVAPLTASSRASIDVSRSRSSSRSRSAAGSQPSIEPARSEQVSRSSSRSEARSEPRSEPRSESRSESRSRSASRSSRSAAAVAPAAPVIDTQALAQKAQRIAAEFAAAQASGDQQRIAAAAAAAAAHIAAMQAAQAAQAQAAAAQAQAAAASPAVVAAAPTPTPVPAGPASGIGAVDPLAIPTPPELAGPIYSHIRRIALQNDLAGADRILRDALSELTSSLSCTIVYPGQDGMWSLGGDDEIPSDPSQLIAVAQARRAIIASHQAIIPVVTTTETVAVITLVRNQRQPAYPLVEQIAMVALAREVAPILHHLAVHHLQNQNEIKADKGSLYRGEALQAHRTRGQEGVIVQLSPGWVKRAYPLLVVTMIAAIVFAVFIKVPTYSTGTAVIVFEGSTSVTSSAAGTVEKVFVQENEAVKKGDALLRLTSPEELAQLTQSETEFRDMQIQFLFDQSDEQIRKSLASAATARDHALARVEARTIRANRDGVVTNLHVKEGVAVGVGGYVLQITDENSEIEVLAFLSGKDGPRLRDKMAMQLELDGYTKARAIGSITHVTADAISGTEAAKLGGEMLAESIAKELQQGTWTVTRARLPSRTFKTEHNTYHYHHGMHAKVEVKVQSKPFLVTLLPALEKYVPE